MDSETGNREAVVISNSSSRVFRTLVSIFSLFFKS
jgi:hypothetical protein